MGFGGEPQDGRYSRCGSSILLATPCVQQQAALHGLSGRQAPVAPKVWTALLRHLASGRGTSEEVEARLPGGGVHHGLMRTCHGISSSTVNGCGGSFTSIKLIFEWERRSFKI